MEHAVGRRPPQPGPGGARSFCLSCSRDRTWPLCSRGVRLGLRVTSTAGGCTGSFTQTDMGTERPRERTSQRQTGPHACWAGCRAALLGKSRESYGGGREGDAKEGQRGRARSLGTDVLGPSAPACGRPPRPLASEDAFHTRASSPAFRENRGGRRVLLTLVLFFQISLDQNELYAETSCFGVTKSVVLQSRPGYRLCWVGLSRRGPPAGRAPLRWGGGVGHTGEGGNGARNPNTRVRVRGPSGHAAGRWGAARGPGSNAAEAHRGTKCPHSRLRLSRRAQNHRDQVSGSRAGHDRDVWPQRRSLTPSTPGTGPCSGLLQPPNLSTVTPAVPHSGALRTLGWCREGPAVLRGR